MVERSGTLMSGRCKLEKWLRNNTTTTKYKIMAYALGSFLFISKRRLMIAMLQCSCIRNNTEMTTEDSIHHRYPPFSP